MLIKIKLFVNKYSNTIIIVMVLLLVIFISFMLKKQIDKFNANKWVEPFENTTESIQKKVIIKTNSDIVCSLIKPEIEFYIVFGIKTKETTIGNLKNNFKRCNILKKIHFQEGSLYRELSIYKENFMECENLISSEADPIRFSHNILHINDGAFKGCDNLEFNKIILPYTLKTIGVGAFNNCRNLKNNIFIPNNVNSIGEYAFDKTNVTKIILEPFRKNDITLNKINNINTGTIQTIPTIYYFDDISDNITHDKKILLTIYNVDNINDLNNIKSIEFLAIKLNNINLVITCINQTLMYVKLNDSITSIFDRYFQSFVILKMQEWNP